MRILAVGAHPDDLEILCAGTLARYVRQGHRVIMCHVTNGNKGHHRIAPRELARIRKKEAQAAAAILGAELIALGLPDAEVTADLATRKRFVDLIRRAKPDVILTHPPDDYAPDHVAVSQLVFDASYISTAPNLKTRHPAHALVAPVYYMDTVAGSNFQPEEYVDITGTLAVKRRMLSQHKSQLEWLGKDGQLNLMELIETVARFRGFQAGVKYAEAFRKLRAWPRETVRRLLP